MSQRKLLLEVWQDFGNEGESLPALLTAGPRGEAARRLLGPKARLLTTIEASSHFEAMTIYYGLMGWGKYTSSHAWDYQPYPEEWIIEQQDSP